MVYAPIIIPTLNRIVHLKRCITSLQANPWAKYTTLIISVDYPPNQRYQEGYNDICAYLQAGIDGFANVEVIYQDTNLGAYQNMQFLLDYSMKKCDRYIFSEDDNEFSPNFIEFIDKGLDIFEDDEDIMAICAVGSALKGMKNSNVVKTQNFAAYGYGMWHAKRIKMYHTLDKEFYEMLVRDTNKLIEVIRTNAGLVFSLQSIIFSKEKPYRMENGQIPIIDQTIKMYLISEHKYAVGACVNKAKNWGRDGSGENCKEDRCYDPEKIEIDHDESFDYYYTDPMEMHTLKKNNTLEIRCRMLAALIKLWIWQLRGGKIKL